PTCLDSSGQYGQFPCNDGRLPLLPSCSSFLTRVDQRDQNAVPARLQHPGFGGGAHGDDLTWSSSNLTGRKSASQAVRFAGCTGLAEFENRRRNHVGCQFA
ncbi:hypothetical protein F441_12429, partial [Phytophthora nicotianae CJ01A1]